MENGLVNQEFLKMMNTLQGRWQEINNKAMLPRYYNAVKDLPKDALRSITEDLLDNSAKFPLPKDFFAAASAWKKSFFLQNGYYFGQEFGNDAASAPLCSWCLDCGITKIEHHNADGFKQLMRCGCATGSTSNAKLPQWDSELSGAFKRVAVAPEWFNPMTNNAETVSTSEKKLFDKVLEWQRIVAKAAQYWADQGFKP